MGTEEGTSYFSVLKWIVMLVAGVPTTLCLTTLVPVLPKMEAALAHDPTDRLLVKMVVAVTGVSMVLGAPIAGWLADKLGRSPLMFWAMLLYAPIGSSGYFIKNLWVMVGTRVLLGMTAATALTIGVTMVGDMLDPATRHRIMGIQVAIAIFAALVALPSAGLLGDINWRLPFMIYLLSLPLAAIIWAVRNEWTSHLPKDDVQSSANEGKNFSISSGLMLLGFIAGTMSTVPMTYMPFELRNLGVASSAAVAAALMVPVIVSGLVSGLFGHVRKRTSSGILFALSFGVAGIGAAITAISTSYTEIICGLFLYGAGIGWLTPNLMSVATEVASAATRGRIVGIVNGAFYSATFIAVLILEPIVRATGPKGALFTMMALSLMASLFFIVGARERRSA